MFKKGELSTRNILYPTYFILALVVFSLLLIYITNSANDINYNKRFFTRDIALLIDTLYLAPGNVIADYNFGIDLYVLEIKDKIKIRGLEDTFFGYNLASDLYGYRLNYLFGFPFGINKIRFIKDKGGITINELPKILEKISDIDKVFISGLNLDFTWPLDNNVVSSCFGKRDMGFNNGIDIRTCEFKDNECINYQKEVRAVENGKVIAILFGKNQDNVIKISHKNVIESSYFHLSSKNVNVNDEVKKGQVIGIAGKHNIDQPKLHFEIKFKGSLVDPLQFFDANKLKFDINSNCNYNRKAYTYKQNIEKNLV